METQTAQADDLSTLLSAAYDGTEPEVTPEPSVEAEPKPEGRARDENGRFAPKEAQPEAEPKVEAPVQTAPPARKAPSSWKPDAQAAFLKGYGDEPLSPEEIRLIIQEAERRETDFHNGINQYKTNHELLQKYQQAIAPYEAFFQANNVPAPEAIASLLQVEHTLRHGDPATKAQMFAKLAQDYGVNMGYLANPPQVDPQLQHLQMSLQNTQAQLQAMRQAQEQADMQKATAEIQRFAQAPGHEHFEAVKESMADLLDKGLATDYESAYQQAVWLRPDIRQSLIERERTEAQRQAEEQLRAKRASSAASSVRGSTPASAGTQTSGSLRDQLEAAYNA